MRPALLVSTTRVALWVAASLMAWIWLVALPKEAQAESIGNVATVKVAGHALGNLTTSPLTLSPSFDPGITDYVLRCQAGPNTIQVTFTAVPGGSLDVAGKGGHTVSLSPTLVENEAFVISASRPNKSNGRGAEGGQDASDPQHVLYWIRCLPHDFPQLNVTKPGQPSPGWYLTGNINVGGGAGVYAMVLDTNGTPVWYRPIRGPGVADVNLLPDGTIAWNRMGLDPNGAFTDFDLKTEVIRSIAAPIAYTDFHELEPMSNGDLMMLATDTKSGVDLTSLGLGASATVQDCVLEERSPSGRLVKQWRISDHISPAQSTHPFPVQGAPGIFDIYHCNSIDTDVASARALLSIRHADAVYLIDWASGVVIWKMGGNAQSDGAQRLEVTNDPEGQFHLQHDARFQPDGNVSLYDDQSIHPGLAARGAVYHVNTSTRKASLVWSYQSPDGRNSAATGSFRRLDGGNDNVIGWGFMPNTLFTEVDSAGRVVLNVAFPASQLAYRVDKVAYAALDHQLLRTAAGLPAV